MKTKKMANPAEVGITPAVHLQLIDCGMDMSVIRIWQEIVNLKPGEIVQLSSFNH